MNHGTKGERIPFRGGQKYRVKATHSLLHLGAGNPGIPLCHPQIPVAHLTGDNVQFRSPLAKLGRKGVPQIDNITSAVQQTRHVLPQPAGV